MNELYSQQFGKTRLCRRTVWKTKGARCVLCCDSLPNLQGTCNEVALNNNKLPVVNGSHTNDPDSTP